MIHHRDRSYLDTFASLFCQTQTIVEQARHARIHDLVVHVIPVPSSPEDPLVDKALKLVRHGLRLHPHGVGQVADAKLTGTDQGMQQPEPCIVGQDLKDAG
jgi:hypothetical protein